MIFKHRRYSKIKVYFLIEHFDLNIFLSKMVLKL